MARAQQHCSGAAEVGTRMSGTLQPSAAAPGGFEAVLLGWVASRKHLNTAV